MRVGVLNVRRILPFRLKAGPHCKYFESDRINRIFRIFFVLINFQKKLMKKQSTFGGINILRDQCSGINVSTQELGYHAEIMSYIAEGIWAYFVSSGNNV